MKRRFGVFTLAVLLALGAVASVAAASDDLPSLMTTAGVAPDSVPNPPYVRIRASGTAIVLEWDHSDPTLTAYETWRAEQPYFQPASGQGVMLGSYTFSAGIYGEGVPFSYLDNGSCGYFTAAGQTLTCSPQSPTAKVVGDTARNYFWLVRAGNGEFADSNRVGEFDFALVKGS